MNLLKIPAARPGTPRPKSPSEALGNLHGVGEVQLVQGAQGPVQLLGRLKFVDPSIWFFVFLAWKLESKGTPKKHKTKKGS